MSKAQEILNNIVEEKSEDEVSVLMKQKIGPSGGMTIERLITELDKVKNKKSIAYITSSKLKGLKRIVGVIPGDDEGKIPMIVMEK